MEKELSSPESLAKLILDLDFHQPLRELVGDFISSILKKSEHKGIAIKVIAGKDVPFFIYVSENESWQYFEGTSEQNIPVQLENILKGNKESILLDGNLKGEVYLLTDKDEEGNLYLDIIAAATKKKLIWDRDILDDQRRIVEKILRKGNHDIRSPFFGVSGFAQLINQKTTDPEVKGYCKTMMESLDRVESIITELVSGFGEKPLRMRPKNISITELIKEIADKSKEMYARCNIDLSFESTEDFYIDADSELIKNAIYGILNNAREELLGGGTIKIVMESTKDHKNVLISIKDSGKGIPADILDSIFKPIFKYQKGDDHLGLGLSNSLNIIKSHGGDIRIKNNREKSTEFVIDLPLAEKED